MRTVAGQARAEVDLLSQASQEGTPFVLPALTPRQYLDRIAQARPQAWQELRSLIDNGFFKKAAESLILYPFDDVAQVTSSHGSRMYPGQDLIPLDSSV